ncbi:helix-turn-helix domain-containing protein [Aquabacter sp. CN5-332]|uniref:TetR/AcrR family transcriptional regulator n=1 Tax=Aquabacter sp. CN5-332 TaxID=3156608 RepID=UPI0032B3BC91
MPSHEKAPSPPGLRDRKRRQTRARIQGAARALFLERGYEGTTVDEIAAAADISRRTFFHYFSSKEDLVHSWQDDFKAALMAGVAAAPAEASLWEASEAAILGAIGKVNREEALAFEAMKQCTPALKARDQLKYEQLEQVFATALEKRLPPDAPALSARFVAMMAVGALRLLGESWSRDAPEEAPEAYARRLLEIARKAAGV